MRTRLKSGLVNVVSVLPNSPINPPADCNLCPRLVALRHDAQAKHPDWFNSPVDTWGDEQAKLMIVGMAPGMAGANRTGRPFTGDHAGDLLFQTLERAGMTKGSYDRRIDDGLVLKGVIIANVVRCVPPQNKPVAAEVNACRVFLQATLAQRKNVQTYFALGRIAHDSFLATLGLRKALYKFGHGAHHDLGGGRLLFDSYHCSRYNTNTRRLTTEMFETALFAAAKHAKIGRWAEA